MRALSGFCVQKAYSTHHNKYNKLVNLIMLKLTLQKGCMRFVWNFGYLLRINMDLSVDPQQVNMNDVCNYGQMVTNPINMIE